LHSTNNIPIELLQYSICNLGYGGNVTNSQDKEILMELIKTFICSNVYTMIENSTREERLVDTAQNNREIKELYDLTGT